MSYITLDDDHGNTFAGRSEEPSCDEGREYPGNFVTRAPFFERHDTKIRALALVLLNVLFVLAAFWME